MNSNRQNLETLTQQGYSVRPIQYLNRGWALLQSNIGSYIGFILLLLVLGAILGGVGVANKRLQPLGNIVNLVIGGPLNAGFLIFTFRAIKRQTTNFSDFFQGFNKFLPYFLANLVVGVLTALGTLLLILPGIYLAVAYSFTFPLMVERRLDFWPAMESSRKLLTKEWFSYFGFILLLGLVNFLGLIPCGLGLLITLPLTGCAIAAAYEDIVGVVGAPSSEPESGVDLWHQSGE